MMSFLFTPASSNKRKRDMDDDMADNTPRVGPSKEIFPWGFLSSIAAQATKIFGISRKETVSVVTNPQASKRQLREQTPLHPGAWPTSPHGQGHTNTSQTVSSRDQRHPLVSKDLHRDRNSLNYWQGVGHEVGLEKQYRNLPKPSPYPPRRPVPKVRPLHSSARLGFNSRGSQPLSRRFQDGDLQGRRTLNTNTGRKSEGSKAKEEKRDDPLIDFDFDLEIEDFLEILPELKRSSKLSRKEQLLKSRRAPSPGLQSAVTNAYRDYQEKKRLEEEERLRPKPPRELITPLPDEILRSLPNLTKLPGGQELNMFGRTPVTARDLLTLRNDTWLNDEVINSWLWELCDKAKSLLTKQMVANGTPIKDDTPRYHAFNTLWYPTMAKSDWHTKVPRWSKRAKVDGANLLKVHKVLIPIHQGAHWTLLVILPQRRIVRYYNSLRGSAAPYLEAAKAWISHELGNTWNETEWQFEHAESGQQINMSDCGVFTSCNALATFYSDSPLEILPTGAMIDAREFMKFILINGGFKDDYEMTKLHPDFRLEADRSVSASKKGKEKAK